MLFLSKLWSRNTNRSDLDRALKSILGFKPKKKTLYQTAFTHRSVNIKNEFGSPINFERLEFLGDAVIDTVVANHLYVKLEQDNEGELTRMKSKIVSREKLNLIGKKLNLLEFLICTGDKNQFSDDINGNLLEALIGAVFIDKGFEQSRKTIFKLILDPYICLDKVKDEIISYKSVLIEWGQKNKKQVEFLTQKEESKDTTINYQTELIIDEKMFLKVREVSKKKAEEKAAKRAFKILNINRYI